MIASTLVQYLRRPIFTAQREPFGRNALSELTQLWAITLGLAIVTVLITTSVYIAIKGRPAEATEGFTELTQSPRFLFTAIIFAPLLEEVLFRSWLGHIRGILLIMPILACIAALFLINYHNSWHAVLTPLACGVILIAFAVYALRCRQTYDRPNHTAAVRRIFPFIFWASTLIFALIHIGNYSPDSFDPAVILLILPQCLIGAILGFVRMRYGLLAAIGFHGAYNSVFATFTFFASSLSILIF